MTTHNHGLRNNVRRWVALAALSGLSLISHAQVNATADGFDRFMYQATGAGKQTIGFSSSGTPVLNPGVPTLSTNGGQNLGVGRTGTMTNPSGNRYNISASGTVPPSRYAPLIKRGLGLVPLLGTGIALYDLANELGFSVSKNSAGDLVVQKPSASYCSNPSGCAAYRWDANFGFGSYGPTTASTISCAVFVGRTGSGSGGQVLTVINTSLSGSYNCNLQYSSNWGPNYGGWGTATRVNATLPYNVTNDPSSLQALEDAIATKSGWPASSNLAKAVNQSLTLTGEKLAVDGLAVTGPATSPGATSTTQNADGTTTTRTTTHNHTYQGDTITTVNNTVITNYNPSTNSSTTTTASETPAPEEQTTDPCQVNPDTVGCAKLDSPTAEVPESEFTISYTPDNLGFGAGACPAPVTWTDSLGTHTIPFTSVCDILTDVIRPLVLLMAALAGIFIVLPRET